MGISESETALDATSRLEAYRLMLRTRAFDEHCAEILEAGRPLPHFHSGIGQEALSVGGVMALRGDDSLIYTHRGIGQLLAKGVSMREAVCDLEMVEGGTNGGIGSVMHVSRPDIGVHGREGVFGTRFGMAVGLALASQLRGLDQVTMCFYGEAAGARGPMYEAMNMAVLWNLPIIFVAENNGWSFTSRTEWLYPEGRMSNVWRGFDIPVEVIDGNDVDVVYGAAAKAVARARTGSGPSVLEGMTYRMDPHIWYDKAEYQPAEELKKWSEKDPLAITRERLLGDGTEPAAFEAEAAHAKSEVEAAFDFAASVPAPEWTGEVVEV